MKKIKFILLDKRYFNEDVHQAMTTIFKQFSDPIFILVLTEFPSTDHSMIKIINIYE